MTFCEKLASLGGDTAIYTPELVRSVAQCDEMVAFDEEAIALRKEFCDAFSIEKLTAMTGRDLLTRLLYSDEENGGFSDMLPVMQSDFTHFKGNRILIIDAKYYAHYTQTQYDVHTLYSGNLHQIFTCDELATRCQETDTARQAARDALHKAQSRNQQVSDFITEVQGLAGAVTEFSEDYRGHLVEKVTVGRKKEMTFSFCCEVEITV